ncbi:MAG: serine/threonine-protein kinase [Pseudoxanthomonas sp.]|nr:serine/threonine-protein kinase [Pseudoxanthomonas sp.]
MSPSLRPRALSLMRELLELPGAQRRQALLALGKDDPALIAEVEALLAADSGDPGPLDTPLSLLPASTAADDLPGSTLGPFLIGERVGRGGMGSVYRGERIGDDFRQAVAVKVLRRGLDSDDIVARFLRERRILAALDHPSVARLVDGGRTPDGRPWLAMEFVHGEPITTWCDRHRVDLRGRLALLLEVAAAVQHAHERLVVHRDLKPANVLVDDQGRVRLLDFGIAKLVDADGPGLTVADGIAVALMTPEYAAPEQFDGGPITAATDVYALGVLLYELVAGRLPLQLDRGDRDLRAKVSGCAPARLAQAPFLGDGDPGAVLARRATGERGYRRFVRGDLERIAETALAKEPERRYATVQALADDLHRLLAGEPVRVSGDDWRYRMGKFMARHAAGAALAAVAALLLAGAAAALAWQWREAHGQARMAMAEADRASAVRDYLTLMFREAGANASAGREATARDVLDASAARVESVFADDRQTRQQVLAALAELYIHLQDYPGAEPLLERFLALEEGDTPAELRIAALDDLAQVRFRQGRSEEALALVEQALVLARADSRAGRRRSVSRILVTRGQVMRTLGRLPEAIADLERAVIDAIATEGADGRQVVVARNSLAATYMAAGRSDDALVEFEQALASLRQLGLGESHEAANILNNQAALTYTRGRLDRAEALFERALAVRERVSGQSAGLGAVSINYGRVLMLRNRLEDAREHLERGLDLVSRFTATDSVDAASARLVLAELALLRDDPATAAQQAAIARADFQGRLGEHHFLAARAQATLAEARLRDDDADASRLLVDAAVATLESQGQAAAPFLAQALCLRAELALLEGRAGQALADAGHCRALRVPRMDADAWPIAEADLLRAAALQQMRRADAAGLRSTSLERLRSTLGPGHPLVRRLAGLARMAAPPGPARAP